MTCTPAWWPVAEIQAARDSLDTNARRVILGLRNETQTTFNHGTGDYDDRLVVWKDHGVSAAAEQREANTNGANTITTQAAVAPVAMRM